jgi:hypothetical protein
MLCKDVNMNEVLTDTFWPFVQIGSIIFGEDTPLTAGSFFAIDVFPLLWYSDIYDYRSVF